MRNGVISARVNEGNESISAMIPDVSLVVPVHDEVESLPLLLERSHLLYLLVG